MLLASGILLISDRQNNPRCDRCILNLVLQQLMSAEDNIFNFSQEQQLLKQLKQIFAHSIKSLWQCLHNYIYIKR